MEINNIKIDKSANYSKSFYKKLNAELTQYKDKNGTDFMNENSCVIEEVDCESSIMRLAYNEPKYKIQGKPVRKKIRTAEKQQRRKNGNGKTVKEAADKKIIEYKAADRKSYKNRDSKHVDPRNFRIQSTNSRTILSDMNKEENILEMERDEEDTKCIIEEVDCKLSLINIGYDEIQENEEETVMIPDIIPESEEEIAEQTKEPEDDSQSFSGIQKESVNVEEKVDEEPEEFNINRYSSSSIVSTVVLYEDDKEDVEEIEEEVITDQEPQFVMFPDHKEEDNGFVIADKKVKPSTLAVIREKEKLFMEGVSKNFLHSEAIHIKNNLGFLSLLAFFGLFGIFTENRGCLGFWAFLYYIRYFYVLPDDIFKANVQKAAEYGFYTQTAISFTSIILNVVLGNTVYFAVGLIFSAVLSMLVFNVLLYFYQFRKSEQGEENLLNTEIIAYSSDSAAPRTMEESALPEKQKE